MGFADGHVVFVRESIDEAVWSAVGTRQNDEVDTTID
jgi:hypothetical protein